MQLRDRFKKQRRGRFERLKIIFPILLARWIPSILTLVVSYTILTKTLESRILRDRQTFWLRARRGTRAAVKRSFRLAASPTLAGSAYGDRYRRRGAGPGRQNGRLSRDLGVGGKNRARFSTIEFADQSLCQVFDQN